MLIYFPHKGLQRKSFGQKPKDWSEKPGASARFFRAEACAQHYSFNLLERAELGAS